MGLNLKWSPVFRSNPNLPVFENATHFELSQKLPETCVSWFGVSNMHFLSNASPNGSRGSSPCEEILPSGAFLAFVFESHRGLMKFSTLHCRKRNGVPQTNSTIYTQT